MKISKLTLNVAERLHVDLFVNDDGNLDISILEQDVDLYGDDGWYQNESIATYEECEEGFKLQNIFNPKFKDLPKLLTSDNELRVVVKYVAGDISKFKLST